MIETRISPVRPQVAEPVFNQFRQRSVVLAFGIKQMKDGQFEYQTATVPPGMFTRSGIVDLLVTERYPDDVMWATVNNYLDNPADQEAQEEFQAMQAWRREAKAIADEALAAL